MKKWFLSIMVALPLIWFIACNKTSSPSTPACQNTDVNTDSSALKKFAADSIVATRDTTGLYYQIVDTGTGVTPAPTSQLSVTYKATLMDHTVFDSASNAVLQSPLYQLIPGWQIGLPKIREGGHIKLLIPSAYAYGCQGATNGATVIIPSNAPVYFDIYLLKVTN